MAMEVESGIIYKDIEAISSLGPACIVANSAEQLTVYLSTGTNVPTRTFRLLADSNAWVQTGQGTGTTTTQYCGLTLADIRTPADVSPLFSPLAAIASAIAVLVFAFSLVLKPFIRRFR